MARGGYIWKASYVLLCFFGIDRKLILLKVVSDRSSGVLNGYVRNTWMSDGGSNPAGTWLDIMQILHT